MKIQNDFIEFVVRRDCIVSVKIPQEQEAKSFFEEGKIPENRNIEPIMEMLLRMDKRTLERETLCVGASDFIFDSTFPNLRPYIHIFHELPRYDAQYLRFLHMPETHDGMHVVSYNEHEALYIPPFQSTAFFIGTTDDVNSVVSAILEKKYIQRSGDNDKMIEIYKNWNTTENDDKSTEDVLRSMKHFVPIFFPTKLNAEE